MDEVTGPALDARRQHLLEAKLGKLLRWQKPDVVDTVGPFDPSVFEHVESQRRDVIAQCRVKLAAYSEAQVEALLAGESKQPDAVHADWRTFLENRLRLPELPWFAGGFGHPDHVADFDYWAKMPRYTVDEITCLSVGVEPGAFPKSELSNLSRSEPDKLWPAQTFLLRQRELLRRQFDPQGHGWHVGPADFLHWAEQKSLAAHPDFLRLLRLYHGPAQTVAVPAAKPVLEPATETAAEPTGARPPDRREIDSIAQLFTAMAIDHLGYRPGQARSPIPKEIAELAASLGLSLSTDTILKYLRLGAKFLPKDWVPPGR